MNARYAVGIGARSGVDAEELLQLVQSVCETSARAPSSACGVPLFTIESKQDEKGLHEAARRLDAPLVFLPLDALRTRKGDLLTHSPRVEALIGVGSVAEAAALVGAGPGSVLLGPRLSSARATCAIARNALDEAP